jgi:hypothetical protein
VNISLLWKYFILLACTLDRLSLPATYTQAWYFRVRLEQIQEPPKVLHLKEGLLALSANIRVGWRCLVATYVTAYYVVINYHCKECCGICPRTSDATNRCLCSKKIDRFVRTIIDRFVRTIVDRFVRTIIDSSSEQLLIDLSEKMLVKIFIPKP